MFGKQL